MSIFTWDSANFNWDNNPYTWDEVELILDIIAEADGNGDTSGQGVQKKVEKLEPKKASWTKELDGSFLLQDDRYSIPRLTSDR